MALMDFKLGEVGGVFTSIREAITGEKIQDPTEVLKQVAKLETTFLQAQSKIISTEANSERVIMAVDGPIVHFRNASGNTQPSREWVWEA